VAATDIETGELVVFDCANGDEISLDYLMASCGFLPEFAPVVYRLVRAVIRNSP
jgi:NTE family protein